MSERLKQQLERERLKADILQAKVDQVRNKALFDISDTTKRHKRARPSIETDGESKMTMPFEAVMDIADCRNLYRNSTAIRGPVNCLRRMVLGSRLKLSFRAQEYRDVEDWFNLEWSPFAEARNQWHLNTVFDLCFTSIILNGGILLHFDSAGIDGKETAGKIWAFEIDQMCEVQEFEKHKKNIARRLKYSGEIIQSRGVIMTAKGRPIGYVVSPKFGITSAKLDDVTILSTIRSKLIYKPWRFSQFVGQPEIMTGALQAQGVNLAEGALLQRMIIQASMALAIKKDTPHAPIEGRNPVDSDLPDRVPQLEKWARGMVEYLRTGESVESIALSGDSVDAKNFLDHLKETIGWSLGLSRMYSTGRADASYSAAMAERNITLPTIEEWRKFFERECMDWVALQALSWGTEEGIIDTFPAQKIGWLGWPKERAINPAQEAGAIQTELGYGGINYEDVLGPNWQDSIVALGQQLAVAKQAGFTPTPFVSGSAKQQEIKKDES